MEILTFPNCRQSIWLAVFFILWTVIVQVICIISGVPSYLCATILYVSTVTILAIAFRTKAMDRSILRFDKPNIKVLLLAAGGTLCLPWVHALIYSIVPFPEFLKKIFTEIGTKDSNEAYIYPFISAILMPFIIEVIFRGIILRGLLTEYGIRKSIIIAAIIYSVVWGCMTLLPVLGLIYGLWFGWLYVYSRSLWTCLITHILLQVSSVAYVMTNYYHPLPQQVNSAMTGDLWIIWQPLLYLFFLHISYTKLLDIMITEITQSNPSQSLIEHDILLQQLQLQQLIILGLVLLVILLIPVAIIMFKRQKQASTYWRSLFQEIEQVNQDVTFRNQTQEAIIASLRERMQTLENQKPAEPSYDEYTEILGFYRKINQPLISFLESIQLSSYEIFICILIFEKVSLKEIANLLGKNYDAVKKRRQRIQNKIKLSGTCKNAEQCIHCPLLNIPQICPTPKGGDVL